MYSNVLAQCHLPPSSMFDGISCGTRQTHAQHDRIVKISAAIIAQKSWFQLRTLWHDDCISMLSLAAEGEPRKSHVRLSPTQPRKLEPMALRHTNGARCIPLLATTSCLQYSTYLTTSPCPGLRLVYGYVSWWGNRGPKDSSPVSHIVGSCMDGTRTKRV